MRRKKKKRKKTKRTRVADIDWLEGLCVDGWIKVEEAEKEEEEEEGNEDLGEYTYTLLLLKDLVNPRLMPSSCMKIFPLPPPPPSSVKASMDRERMKGSIFWKGGMAVKEEEEEEKKQRRKVLCVFMCCVCVCV
jgi:hypothetical protein